MHSSSAHVSGLFIGNSRRGLINPFAALILPYLNWNRDGSVDRCHETLMIWALFDWVSPEASFFAVAIE